MEQISGQRKEGRGRDRCERRLEEKKGEINYCGGTVHKQRRFSPQIRRRLSRSWLVPQRGLTLNPSEAHLRAFTCEGHDERVAGKCEMIRYEFPSPPTPPRRHRCKFTRGAEKFRQESHKTAGKKKKLARKKARFRLRSGFCWER